MVIMDTDTAGCGAAERWEPAVFFVNGCFQHQFGTKCIEKVDINRKYNKIQTFFGIWRYLTLLTGGGRIK